MYDNLNIYYKKIENNNMIYSVDKIRLKTYITHSKFTEIEFLVNSVYKDNIKRFWVSERIMCFHYNYNLEFDDFSFWFGFMHNNEGVNYNKDNLEYNFTIEFNPNKAKEHPLILNILSHFGNWYLRALDLAVDIPINILDLILDIGGRHKIQKISYGGDNVTYNLGKGDGRIKIYNKKRESDLPIVNYLTRVEVSREFDDFPITNTQRFQFDKSYFPEIFLNQYVFSFTDYTTKDKTLMGLLYAVQSGYPLKELSRTYRDKVKELLEGGSRIKFDKISSTQAVTKCIYSYFVRRGSKQVIF